MLGEEIKRKVVAKLEEFSPYAPNEDEAGPLLSGQDKLDEIKPIYSYVDENIVQAANEILLVAPLDKLESEKGDQRVCIKSTDFDKKITGTVCMICLPNDFLRLRALRLNTWTEAVEVAIHPNTPLANRQKRWPTMGTFTKPVVVLDENKLYCYSVKPGAELGIKEFRYVPQFDTTWEYSDNIAEIIALNCAKKVYEIFQNIEGAKMMADEMESAMNAIGL